MTSVTATENLEKFQYSDERSFKFEEKAKYDVKLSFRYNSILKIGFFSDVTHVTV